jgi:hypothetical protein
MIEHQFDNSPPYSTSGGIAARVRALESHLARLLSSPAIRFDGRCDSKLPTAAYCGIIGMFLESCNFGAAAGQTYKPFEERCGGYDIFGRQRLEPPSRSRGRMGRWTGRRGTGQEAAGMSAAATSPTERAACENAFFRQGVFGLRGT